MNRSELADYLYREGVNPLHFSLHGGRPEDGFAIDRRGGTWVVYYIERGQESDHHSFDSEDEACGHMAERLVAYEAIRFQGFERSVSVGRERVVLDAWLTSNGVDPATFGEDDVRSWPELGSTGLFRIAVRTQLLPDRLRLQPRNVLRGTVRRVSTGVDVSTVVVELGDGQRITSAMPTDEKERMRLFVGKEVSIVLRESDVLVLRTDEYWTHPTVYD